MYSVLDKSGVTLNLFKFKVTSSEYQVPFFVIA